MSDWQHDTFSTLFAEGSRNGLSVTKSLRGSGAPMVGMKELFAHDVIKGHHSDLVPVSHDALQKWELRSNDLLFGRRSLTREGAGKVSIVDTPPHRAVFESSLIRVRLDPRRCDPRFYFYFFRSTPGRALMDTIIEQTAVAGIRSSDLARVRVPVPPLSEQRAIAEALSSFDELIDHNRRLVGDAQSLLQTAFRAFQGGNPSVAPTGWTDGRLGDLLTLVRNPTKPGLEPTLPYVPIDTLPMRSLALERFRPNEEAKSSLTLFERDDILVGAMRVYFHRVVLAPTSGITRNTTFVLRAKEAQALPFALLLCNEPATIEYANVRSKGSTMPYAVWDGALADMPVQIPPAEVLASFEEQTRPIINYVRDSAFEIDRLTKVRDELLAMLMNRSITVQNAEGAVA